ncbi:enoyl-CoA hydratase/isomerase family protein [Chloroflexota bacterium]
MSYKDIIYSVEGSIAVITINRPDVLNALTLDTHAELAQAVVEADRDDNIRVMVITGAGKGFCSGQDVQDSFGGGEGSRDVEAMRGREAKLGFLQGKRPYPGGIPLLTVNTPSIAAVNGAAVGVGCDLALMCDMRIASDKAKFGELFVRVGIIPDEALLVLPRLVGLGKTYELMLTADVIDANEAERIGLVNRTVPHEELMNATMELATKIAEKAPIAVRLAKEGIRRSINMQVEEIMQWQAMAQAFCLESGDHQEGIQAFIEKREPQFKGK